jgi:hypothetical protein
MTFRHEHAEVPALLIGESPAQNSKHLAQVRRLNEDLLSRASATATLQTRCDQSWGGVAPQILARRVAATASTSRSEAQRVLGAASPEGVKIRHVELICGGVVLSRAENWYRPDALTLAMNRLLEETETPFGVAVGALDYRRTTLTAEILSPHPFGPTGPATQILRHHAVLIRADGLKFSLLTETYSSAVLGAGPK